MTIYMIILIHLQHYRFALITLCWHKDPDKRLTFVEMVVEMNRLIEPLADYLDFTKQSKEQQNTILSDS